MAGERGFRLETRMAFARLSARACHRAEAGTGGRARPRLICMGRFGLESERCRTFTYVDIGDEYRAPPGWHTHLGRCGERTARAAPRFLPGGPTHGLVVRAVGAIHLEFWRRGRAGDCRTRIRPAGALYRCHWRELCDTFQPGADVPTGAASVHPGLFRVLSAAMADTRSGDRRALGPAGLSEPRLAHPSES